jgi:hypothetical protein
LKAYDIEVLELAISVIFYACLPSSSLTSSPLEADWKEGVEVSYTSSKFVIFSYIEVVGVVDYSVTSLTSALPVVF